ncbi:MAG: lipocalin-like domain-containing protein [Bacteroidales bacterium]|nr:lipocalin-like domain-containing protein [Bacteroidales bacterium]
MEGRWQTTTIESPQHFLETDSLFWSFDSGVCEIQTLRNSYPHYAEQIFANYLLYGDSIKISVPENYKNLAKRNRYLDWKTSERKFAIRELTTKSLKLSVNDTIYSFRKYY